MDEETEIKKEILGLKFQDRLSRSNILLGSIIPLVVGLLSLGGMNTALSIKIVIGVYSSIILFRLGQRERDKASEKINEIRSLR